MRAWLSYWLIDGKTGRISGDLESFLDRIRQMPGIERAQTSIILNTNFERVNIPQDK